MNRLRAFLPARRTMLVAWLALALAVRVLIPAGWMPMIGTGGGTVLVLCSGSGPEMTGMVMAGHAPGRHDAPAPAGERECPFSAVALPSDLPVPSILPAPPPARSIVPGPRPGTVRPGRGLAAPPPPSTGPPPLA